MQVASFGGHGPEAPSTRRARYTSQAVGDKEEFMTGRSRVRPSRQDHAAVLVQMAEHARS